MRARHLGLVLLILAACTEGPSVNRPVDATSAPDAPQRLETLGRAWFRTSATVTFDTQVHAPGEPASEHQCIRQLWLGDQSSIDRVTAIRMCARQGELRLAWAPPDRWRMDVTTPTEAYTLLWAPGEAARCDGTGEHLGHCTARPPREVATELPFRWALATPDRILDRIGATGPNAVTSVPDRTIAGLDAQCFRASGVRDQEAGWCYSSDGSLLFLTTSTADGWSASLEATRVSTEVSAIKFRMPSG
jgi:hypothetical protein